MENPHAASRGLTLRLGRRIKIGRFAGYPVNEAPDYFMLFERIGCVKPARHVSVADIVVDGPVTNRMHLHFGFAATIFGDGQVQFHHLTQGTVTQPARLRAFFGQLAGPIRNAQSLLPSRSRK